MIVTCSSLSVPSSIFVLFLLLLLALHFFLLIRVLVQLLLLQLLLLSLIFLAGLCLRVLTAHRRFSESPHGVPAVFPKSMS